VWELGGVPQISQSDNSSTATHELGRGRPGRGYNARYLSGMRPGLIGVGEAHQNGDVESAHNHLAAAIDQALSASVGAVPLQDSAAATLALWAFMNKHYPTFNNNRKIRNDHSPQWGIITVARWGKITVAGQPFQRRR
jgi:hypothetical protein